MNTLSDGMQECIEPAFNLSFAEEPPAGAHIKVVGVGGGGSSAVNRMVKARLEGVEFVAMNTDIQALNKAYAPVKVQLGSKLTQGLGAGADPEIGRRAAVEDTGKIIEILDGAHMVFITAGLGGGTGTGAAPIVASLAKELEALTVAIVTRPFRFEGKRRMEQAEQGLMDLKEHVDTIITIPNERLLHTIDRGTSFLESFAVADDVLRQAVQGISDLITIPGEINLDFADVKAVMKSMGMAVMGTGVAEGEDRAVAAAQRAISSPLLEEASIDGAMGVLINVTGGRDMTLFEVNEASQIIQESASEDANIIFGTVIDESMEGQLKITVIATGFDRQRAAPQISVSEAKQIEIDEPEVMTSWQDLEKFQSRENPLDTPEKAPDRTDTERNTPPSEKPWRAESPRKTEEEDDMPNFYEAGANVDSTDIEVPAFWRRVND